MSEEIALSRNGVPIRLPDERWHHIIEEHAELDGMRDMVLQTVADAERVVVGSGGELFATRTIEPGKAIVTVYREVDVRDGFVIPAFLTRRLRSLDRRIQVWPPQV
jgi:hypothetical protein